MIIALIIAFLFGGGSLEVFYIDKIEQGVKKYVTDKDRKKNLQGYFKEYQTTFKNYNKGMQSDLKNLKKQNLDRAVAITWYEDFFKKRLDATAKIQHEFIDYRINLQNAIQDDEWTQIMELASSAEQKQQEKEDKEARKNSDKDLMHNLRKTANENIVNPASKKEVLAAWDIFKEDYDVTIETYDHINVEDNETIVNKNVSAEELEGIIVKLDSIRAKMYVAHIGFLKVLKANTSNDEYASIMKEFNKLLK
jgi:hypothetical protein